MDMKTALRLCVPKYIFETEINRPSNVLPVDQEYDSEERGKESEESERELIHTCQPPSLGQKHMVRASLKLLRPRVLVAV